jgi:amino acid transporter
MRCISALSSNPHHNCIYNNIEKELGINYAILYSSTEFVKLNFVIASVSTAIVGYMQEFRIINMSTTIIVTILTCLYFIFCITNMFGSNISGGLQCFITSSCLLILFFYYLSLLFYTFQFNQNALNSTNSWFISSDINNFSLSFPFSCWMFLGFEEIPLLDGKIENKNVALKVSFIIVTLSAICTILIGASSPPGIIELSKDISPIISGIKHVYGNESLIIDIINICVIFALASPFHTFILYAANQIRELSLDGLLPSFLSNKEIFLNKLKLKNYDINNNNNNNNNSPINALCFVGLSGIIVVTVLSTLFGIAHCQKIFISSSLIPSMISYFIQLQSLRLKINKSVNDSKINYQEENKNINSPLLVINNDNNNNNKSLRGFNLELYIGQMIILFIFICLVYSSFINLDRFIGLILGIGVTICLYSYIYYRINSNNIENTLRNYNFNIWFNK